MTDSQLTTFSLGIPAPGQTQPAYMYTLRLGAADPKVDNYVVYGENGSYTMAATPTGDDPRANEGIVLYSYDNFTVYAPTSQTVSNIWSDWSAESLSVTLTNGLVSNASFSSKGLISTYASAAQMAINASDLVSLNGGNTMTVWAGNDASTGIGGLLWSNFGFTQNVFGGQVVNITAATPISGGVMEVQGWGEAKLAGSIGMSAGTSITLSVDPLLAPNSAAATYLKNIALYGTGLMTIVAAVEDVAIGTTLDVLGSPTQENYDKIKATLQAAAYASATLSSLIVVFQAMAALAGVVASGQVAASAVGTMPTLSITVDGAEMYSGGAPMAGIAATVGQLLLNCGVSSIELTPATSDITATTLTLTGDTTLTLVCGASSITLTDASVAIAGTDVTVNGVSILGA